MSWAGVGKGNENLGTERDMDGVLAERVGTARGDKTYKSGSLITKGLQSDQTKKSAV